MTDLSGLGLPALDWGEVFHVGIAWRTWKRPSRS